MPEGLAVTIRFRSREEIWAHQPGAENYFAKALTFMDARHPAIWLPAGPLNLEILRHEMQHAAGRTHDNQGRWHS